jgi:hypothetical protein
MAEGEKETNKINPQHSETYSNDPDRFRKVEPNPDEEEG